MTDQAQAVEEDVHNRMTAILEAEDATPEEEETEQLEASETEETEATEEEAEEETPEEETLELNWNGELKAFKKSEVVELAQKGYDYTQKTQQIAEQRKTLEAQAELMQQQAYINSQLSDKLAEIKGLDSQLAQYKQVNWQELAQSDPMQYLTLNQTYQQLKDARNEAVGLYQNEAQKLTQAQQAQRDEIMAREARLMADAVPELRGEKAQQTKQELASYLQSRGFSDSEIGGIMDHRMVKVAFEAAQYAKLKSAQPEVKKRMAEAPKVVKGKQPAPNNQVQELKQRAKRGDERAAAALIERMI